MYILFMPSLGSGYYVFFGNMTVSPLARLPAAHTPCRQVKHTAYDRPNHVAMAEASPTLGK